MADIEITCYDHKLPKCKYGHQVNSDEMMTLMGGAAPTCDLLDSLFNELRLQLVMLVGTCNLKHMSLHLWMSFARSNLELATP